MANKQSFRVVVHAQVMATTRAQCLKALGEHFSSLKVGEALNGNKLKGHVTVTLENGES